MPPRRRPSFSSSGTSPRPPAAPRPTAPSGPLQPWGQGHDLSTQPSVLAGPWGSYAQGGAPPPQFQTPPPGSYDPALQQNLVGAGVGLTDLLGGNIDPATGHYIPPATDAQGHYIFGPNSQYGLAQSRGTEDYATGRNLLDTQHTENTQDIGITYGRGQEDINRQYGYGMQDFGNQRQDLATQYGRNTQDIGTTFSRGTEDVNRQLAGLQRQYSNLGQRQTQQAGAQGVGEGGATRQSALKRQANEAFDRQPIDTAQQRLGEDYGAQGRYATRAREDLSTGQSRIFQGEQRLGAEYGPGGYLMNRLTEDYGPTGRYQGREDVSYGQGLGALNTGYNRQQQDIGIGASQAIRDYGLFGANTAQSQWYQAGQSLSPSALQTALGVGPDPRFAPPRRLPRGSYVGGY